LAKIIYLLLFVAAPLFAQMDQIMELYPLELIDKLTAENREDLGEEMDTLQNQNYFFLSNYQQEEGLYFVKKQGSEWLVFDFQLDSNYGPNTMIRQIKSENEGFVSIASIRFNSGSCPGKYGLLTLLDVNTARYIRFCNYQEMACYDQNGDVSSNSVCSTEFIIENGFMEIRNKSIDIDLDCFESSEYRIEKDRFIKSKYYSRSNKRLFDVNCIDKVCKGMLITDFKKAYKNASFKQSPLYVYGFDSDELGYEVWIDNEIHFFLVVREALVVGVVVLSPKYSMNGINTTTTVSTIFEKYPKAKMYVDLMTNWEYVYLKEAGITLIFKTEENNRIGIYDADPEDAANGILMMDVKIDLIQM